LFWFGCCSRAPSAVNNQQISQKACQQPHRQCCPKPRKRQSDYKVKYQRYPHWQRTQPRRQPENRTDKQAVHKVAKRGWSFFHISHLNQLVISRSMTACLISSEKSMYHLLVLFIYLRLNWSLAQTALRRLCRRSAHLTTNAISFCLIPLT